jgi:hypothetical protein
MKYKEEEKVIKTFESFLGKSKWDQYQNLSKPQEGEVDIATRNSILDVNNFNKWLSEDFNYGGYKGAPGIVGRIDKLSSGMVVAYFLDQGVECTDEEIRSFQEKIRKTWNESR